MFAGAARRWGPDLGLLIAGLLLGAAVARGASAPAVSSVAAPVSERPPVQRPVRSPPRPARPARAAETDDPELAELSAEIRDLEAEGRRIGALPGPWPEDVAAEVRPAAVQAALDRLMAEQPDPFAGVQARVDCSEYPCLVVYERDATVDQPPPPFEDGYRLYSTSDGELSREVYSPLGQGVERRLDVRRRLLTTDEP